MGYQRETTTSDISIHVGQGKIDGWAKSAQHDYSDGPYAVVKLALPGTDIHIFPGLENVDALQSAFAKIAAELAEFAESEAVRVTALED